MFSQKQVRICFLLTMPSKIYSENLTVTDSNDWFLKEKVPIVSLKKDCVAYNLSIVIDTTQINSQ